MPSVASARKIYDFSGSPMLRGENQVHQEGEPDFLKPFKGNTCVPAFVQTFFLSAFLGIKVFLFFKHLLQEFPKNSISIMTISE